MARYVAPLILGLAVAIVTVLVGRVPAVLAADYLVATGSGSQTHFDIGRALCRQIARASDGLTCEARQIEGGDAAEPLAVLSDIRTGAIELGIVASDWHHHAVNGSGPVAFMDVAFDNLRSLFSLHGEPFSLVARNDSGITSIDDLAGKRVNIGNPGSDQRAIMDLVMAAKGWTPDSFQLADELTGAEQSLALCHDRVQAMVLTVAHPDEALARTMELCDARLVAVAGAEIDKLVSARPFLVPTPLGVGLYPAVEEPVQTFGVVATLVTSEDLADEQAYAVVEAVFDNLDRFKKLHPALGSLVPAEMMTNGLAAPLHPGALRFFQERGLM